MKVLLLALFLYGGAFGTAVAPSNTEKSFITANLNDYIDTVLPAISDYMVHNDLDPMELPDLLEGFSAKPLWIEYHGELELTKGSLTGLRSIARSGDFNVAYLNKILKVRGDFGFKDLGFTYRYLAKIMNIGPTGGVVGKVSKISGVLDLLIDFNNNEIHLQEFYLHSVGKITVKLTGNILVDWLSNAIVKVITTLFKSVIVNVIEGNLKDAIQVKLDEINNKANGVSQLLKEYPIVNIFKAKTLF